MHDVPKLLRSSLKHWNAKKEIKQKYIQQQSLVLQDSDLDKWNEKQKHQEQIKEIFQHKNFKKINKKKIRFDKIPGLLDSF